MLLPREIPPSAQAFNRRWHAPDGRALGWRLLGKHHRRARRFPWLVGPFGFQPNNDTRIVEYPWAHDAIAPRPGMVALEIGGGKSGLQFVLSKAGVRVINVDPGKAATGIGRNVTPRWIEQLNQAFRTDVELRPCTLAEANIADESVDVVYSVSTIEHIPSDEVGDLMRGIARILKPGGRVVLTIDLFIALAPFTSRVENAEGWNVDIAKLVAASGLQLHVGRPDQLLGYPEFDPDKVLAHLDEHFLGTRHPVCVQALVLTKSATA
jgi:SAM-dependent methyltransferase